MGIIFSILMIGGIIIVHETGHYVLARMMGVHVVEFSIGFGPRIFVRKGKKRHPTLPPTEFSVALLPFGGFVKMLGVDPQEVVPEGADDVSFGKKPVWRRFLIMVAGPAFNFGLPLVLFFAIGLGTSTLQSTFVADVDYGGPAWSAGIRAGDRITSIDGDTIDYWWQLVNDVEPRSGEAMPITWTDAAGRPQHGTVTPHAEPKVIVPDVVVENVGRLGIAANYAEPIIAVEPGSPAAAAGLGDWDRVLDVQVGGDTKVIKGVKQALALVAAAPDQPVTIHYLHYADEARVPFAIAPATFATATLAPVAAGADPLRGLGSSECVVWRTVPGSPAAALGLQPGDRIVRLGDRACESWSFASGYLEQHVKDPIPLVIRRAGAELPPMELKFAEMVWPNDMDKTAKAWVHGIVVQADYADPETVANGDRLGYGWNRMWQGTGDALGGTVKMLGALFSGKVSLKDGLGGPVAIAQMAQKAGEEGWDHFFALMGGISISIGLLNLLPIPILDGGQILFLALEGIRRRPVSMRTRMIAIYTSLAFVVVLMVLVLKNDLSRIFG